MESNKQFRSYERSEYCKRAINPSADFLVNGFPSQILDPTSPKVQINVTYGDPCEYKDFQTCEKDKEILSKAVGNLDGYVDFRGMPEIRRFLRDFYMKYSNFKIEETDIYITQGCDMAMWLAVNSLAEHGNNILIPNPGYPIPKVILKREKILVKEYSLLPHQNWEIDLNNLKTQIDSNTKAILVINPSNPTGAVFSRKHMEEILKIAEDHKIPIIADEIYSGMVYPGEKFFSFAEISNNVPILLCSGLSKKYSGPGWRTGWLVLNGPKGIFDEIKRGLNNLCSVIMNSNTITMQSIPKIFDKQPEFLLERMRKISERMETLKENLKGIDCYEVLQAKAALYAIILVDVSKFNDINDTKEFCLKFYKSHNVKCFPGECFGGKNFIRIVTCSDVEAIKELCKRMIEFYYMNKKI